MLGPLGNAHEKSKDTALSAAGRITSQSFRLRTQLLPFAPGTTTSFGSSATYPTSNDQFPRRMAGLAAMLAMRLPLRCVTLEAPGMYDTHAQQADELSDSLKLTADTLLAFQRDLESRGSPTGCSSTSGRSSAGARRRTRRSGPTTARPGRDL